MQTTGRAMATNGGMAKIEQILGELEQNLKAAKLSLKQAETLLSQLKVLGREPSICGPIFTPRGISLLSQYALDDVKEDALPMSREALRCLANACLLNEGCRQIFVDTGYAPKAAERLKVDDRDDEFVVSRLLFLLTYHTTVDFQALEEKHQLASSINMHVERHAKIWSSNSARSSSAKSPMEDMSLAETAKLMFNLTYYYPNLVPKFEPSIESLVRLLIDRPLPDQPLQSPLTFLLNALLNLDLATAHGKTPTSSPLVPQSDPEVLPKRLTTIFYEATLKTPERELDQTAAPLLTLIRRIYEIGHAEMCACLRTLMLPSESDRSEPLGRRDTLSGKLLRMSSSPNLPTLRQNISGLLFELSDKDANTFVKNVGYGYASGYLMSHNIELPREALGAHRGSGSGDASTGGDDINPITGQKLSAEGDEKPGTNDMTEEEKEREAERLFVLFERLRATGVVDVKNPVQQAIDEGRFEEISD